MPTINTKNSRSDLGSIDHIAIQSDAPIALAKWYEAEFGAEILYLDDTWGFLQFDNIKLAIVHPKQHPAHIAFEVESFSEEDTIKKHRDGSESAYKKDPSGNIYELIKY